MIAPCKAWKVNYRKIAKWSLYNRNKYYNDGVEQQGTWARKLQSDLGVSNQGIWKEVAVVAVKSPKFEPR